MSNYVGVNQANVIRLWRPKITVAFVDINKPELPHYTYIDSAAPEE